MVWVCIGSLKNQLVILVVIWIDSNYTPRGAGR
jgi:hypothetical protein